MRTVRNNNWLCFFAYVCFCALFLITGLSIYDHYGPVSEERNQIDAGHITWAAVTGDKSHYPDLPDLDRYANRYYGQGATFVTVLLEALAGFRWDVNKIWKVRRLWNFFCFFAAANCLFWILKKRFTGYLPAFFGVLNLILLPRMFPEIFYNDRDPMFLSWLIFSFTAMLIFLRKTNVFTAVLLGFVTAITVNVRLFGLILIIPFLLILFRYPAKRRSLIFALIVFFAGWYALSPIGWKNPLQVIRTAVIHLTTKQRMIDTRGSIRLLFAGNYYPEDQLPWYYLPLWILISTPVPLLCFAAYGCFACLRFKHEYPSDGFAVMDISLAVFFMLFLIAIPLIRPTMYSTWRHFYFLNLSLVWFAVIGFRYIFNLKKRPVKVGVLILEIASLVLTLSWMVEAHPYEMIYYDPIFRRAAADNFERDTGFTSTRECLEFLEENEAEQRIEVMDANAFISYSLIGLPRQERERFSTLEWKIQRTPMRYIIFNYNNHQGNEYSFPYCAPIYCIERNGTKLAEVFQRTNNRLLPPEDYVLSIHASVNDGEAWKMLSDGIQDIWMGGEDHDSENWIELVLKDGTILESIELFPGEITPPSESLRFYTSPDGGNEWNELTAKRNGTNGWLFSPETVKYLRICSDGKSGLQWQVRRILLYGRDE